MLPSRSARPSSIRAASHRLRSCSGSGTSRPRSSVRAGRRASRSSISASRQAASVSSGSRSVDHPSQPDRLGRQVGSLGVGTAGGGVPLVEDQVEDVEDRREPRLTLLRVGQGEPGAGLADPLLGARDALRHGRLRDQERAGDLGRGEATDGAQRQRDRRGRGQRRVAGHEEHREGVVPLQHVVRRRLGARGPHLSVAPGCVAAVLVDQPPRRRGHQPAERVLGDPVAPVGVGDDERLLDGVLGAVEVAVPSDEDGEDLRRELAQQVLDLVHRQLRVACWR